MSGRSASSSVRSWTPVEQCTARLADVSRPVQPEPLDLGGDRRRHELVDRPPARDPLADLGRRDVERRDREQLDPLGARQRGEHRSSASAVDAGPGRDAEPRELEHPLRLASTSGRRRARRRRSGRADRRGPSASSESTVRAMRVERDLRLVDRRERELGEPRAGRGAGVSTSLCPGSRDDADEQPVEPEMLDRLAREGDVAVVRRVEGAAEDPDRRSLPVDHLVADLDLGARLARPRPGAPPRAPRPPAACRRRGSPCPVRSTRNGAARRPRPVLEEVGQLGRGRLDGSGAPAGRARTARA